MGKIRHAQTEIELSLPVHLRTLICDSTVTTRHAAQTDPKPLPQHRRRTFAPQILAYVINSNRRTVGFRRYYDILT